VGKLGKILFMPGEYLYIGSGKKHLLARIKRHLKKTKTVRWHIDYLTTNPHVEIIKIFVSELDELGLVQKILDKLSDHIISVKGFGATDSIFDSHLFYSPISLEDYLQALAHPLTL